MQSVNEGMAHRSKKDFGGQGHIVVRLKKRGGVGVCHHRNDGSADDVGTTEGTDGNGSRWVGKVGGSARDETSPNGQGGWCLEMWVDPFQKVKGAPRPKAYGGWALEDHVMGPVEAAGISVALSVTLWRRARAAP